MQGRIVITGDQVTPALQRAVKKISDKRPLLEAGALQVQSWAQAAFEDPGKRPAPWPARKGSSNRPLLKKSRALQQSIRVVSVTDQFAVVGTDRKYAAYHQFGTGRYVIKPKSKKALMFPGAPHPVARVNHPGIPARPFFPVDRRGVLIPAAAQRVMRVIARKVALTLGLDRDALL